MKIEGIKISVELESNIKKLKRISIASKIFKWISYGIIITFVIGLFFSDISFYLVIDYQLFNQLRFSYEIIMITLEYVLVMIIIGIVFLGIWFTLKIIYENKLLKTKQAIVEDEKKSGNNIEDKLIPDNESQIEYKRNRSKKIDYFMYIIYYITILPVSMILTLLFEKMLDLENGILPITILVQIFNAFVICFSIYCYFFDSSKFLLKVFRNEILVDTILSVNKITLIPHAILYSISLSSLTVLLPPNTGFSIFIIYIFTMNYFFIAFFTFVFMMMFSLVLHGLHDRFRKEKLPSDNIQNTKVITKEKATPGKIFLVIINFILVILFGCLGLNLNADNYFINIPFLSTPTFLVIYFVSLGIFVLGNIIIYFFQNKEIKTVNMTHEE